MIGMRNQVIHMYDGVDVAVVYDNGLEDPPAGTGWDRGQGGTPMPRTTIDLLIIHSPYAEPLRYWR